MVFSLLPSDPDARRDAERYGHVLTVLTAVLLGVAVVGMAVTGRAGEVVESALFALPYFAVAVLAAFNSARGYRYVSPTLHILSMLFLVNLFDSAFLYLSGSTSTPIAAFYALQIILPTIYFGERVGAVALGLTLASFALIVSLEYAAVVEYSPYFPEKQYLTTIPNYTQSMVVAISITCVISYVPAVYISRALACRRDELASANQDLRTLDETKNRFLSVVSHDLRTPVTSIKAFAEIIEEEAGRMAPEDEKKFARTIVTESDRLHRLVTDLLDLDKMEAGKMDWDLHHQDIRPVLDASAAVFRAAARDKHITLVEDVADDLPAIHADQDRLSQLVANLLSNAIKFTPDGGTVTLHATCSNTTEPPRLEIAVSDTGPGIPADDVATLFDRFSQTATGKKEGGGTGLGLAIAREIAHGHGGEITVDSVPGSGTTFSVLLPISGGPAAAH